MGILNGQGIARAFRDKSKVRMAGSSAVADETGTVLIPNIPCFFIRTIRIFPKFNK
jgi:hypothetical protein